eukprot:5546967-Prymnesium_polylepis.1
MPHRRKTSARLGRGHLGRAPPPAACTPRRRQAPCLQPRAWCGGGAAARAARVARPLDKLESY